jgi:lysozyme
VQGIDVSAYQGAIAWSEVKAAGMAFAFARISDGTTAPDSQFASNWKAMKTAGLLRGSYQYFRASEDPMAQASLIASILTDAGGLTPGDLPVVMDIETADNQSNSTVQLQMKKWLDTVANETGRSPIIYTNAATSAIIGSGFADHTLWVANWGTSCPTMPSGWSTWKFWQNSDTGLVSGISGAVDLDEFDGTLADLTSFAAAERSDAGGGPLDSGSNEGPDTGADGVPSAAAAMGGGASDASRPAQSCSP